MILPSLFHCIIIPCSFLIYVFIISCACAHTTTHIINNFIFYFSAVQENDLEGFWTQMRWDEDLTICSLLFVQKMPDPEVISAGSWVHLKVVCIIVDELHCNEWTIKKLADCNLIEYSCVAYSFWSSSWHSFRLLRLLLNEHRFYSNCTSAFWWYGCCLFTTS